MIQSTYTEDQIKTLDWKEHIRARPGMYIGKLGDGSSSDDGIYILLKEIVDNSIDEYVMGIGKKIEITLVDDSLTVRDYGRGIPLGKMIDAVSKMNTGGKYDSTAFKKSVGLNGVGTKAVNALSCFMKVQSTREKKTKIAEFNKGILLNDFPEEITKEPNGTTIVFTPDKDIFLHFKFRTEYIEKMIRNYVYLNPGLRIIFNGIEYFSENGL
ncbi:MAG: ATP-binding protein, partial [Solirubrobacteraceae bacterium]